MITLNEINIDDQVLIKKIKGDEALKRRLLDLGFIPNSYVSCILIAPFKDPKAYNINQNTIALRNKEAMNIEVEYAKD